MTKQQHYVDMDDPNGKQKKICLASVLVLSTATLLCVFCLSVLLYVLTTQQEKIPIFVDTDSNTDDIMALLYLVPNNRIHVKGITTSGNAFTKLLPGTHVILRTLAYLNDTTIPVAMGAEHSLTSLGQQNTAQLPASFQQYAQDLYGMMKYFPENRTDAIAEHAVEFLHAHINKYERVRLLSLGSLTNYALWLRKYPEDAKRVERLYIMGGAVNVSGNLVFESANGTYYHPNNTKAEFNIFFDPDATQFVIQNATFPITLVPLDATNHCPVTERTFESFAQIPTGKAYMMYKLLEGIKELLGFAGMYFWDPLVAVASAHEQVLLTKQVPITVVTEAGDENGFTKEDWQHGKLIDVAYNVASYDYFVQLMNNGLKY